MTILASEDLYHTGIVVADLEAALAAMTELGGYRWTPVMESPFMVWTPAGEQTVPFRCAYSVDKPHLELVQQVPGTVWTAVPGNAAHHIGYFVDDLAAASQAMTDAGRPVEACGVVEGRYPSVFAYHKGADGIRIEVVDRSVFGGDFGAFVEAIGAQASGAASVEETG